MDGVVDTSNVPSTRAFEQLYVRPRRGRTLIVGSHLYEGRPDRRAAFENAIGTDMTYGPGVDHVGNLEVWEHFYNLGVFKHIECTSVLEHCERPWLAAETIQKLLRPKGTLFLTVPFIWRPHAYPNDFWRFTRECVRVLFKDIEWETLIYSGAIERHTQNLKSELGSNLAIPLLPRTEVYGFGRKKA